MGQYHLKGTDTLQMRSASGGPWEDIPVVECDLPPNPKVVREKREREQREQEITELINKSPTLSKFLAEKAATTDKEKKDG